MPPKNKRVKHTTSETKTYSKPFLARTSPETSGPVIQHNNYCRDRTTAVYSRGVHVRWPVWRQKGDAGQQPCRGGCVRGAAGHRGTGVADRSSGCMVLLDVDVAVAPTAGLPKWTAAARRPAVVVPPLRRRRPAAAVTAVVPGRLQAADAVAAAAAADAVALAASAAALAAADVTVSRRRCHTQATAITITAVDRFACGPIIYIAVKSSRQCVCVCVCVQVPRTKGEITNF